MQLQSQHGAEADANLKKTVEEIKKLQEEVSALRQENIQLKVIFRLKRCHLCFLVHVFCTLQEEALRQKRIAAANRGPHGGEADAHHKGAGAAGAGYSSTLVTASNPAATSLSMTYVYIAIVVLILGMVIGKWVL